MIIGGAFRGYSRALRITLDCSLCYFVVGTSLIVAAVTPFAGWHRIGVFLIFSFLMFPLFPATLAANLLFARLFRLRTWRNERWRTWAAGALGIVVTAAGMVLLGFLSPRMPRFLEDFPGQFGAVLYCLGWMVLFSNLGLLVAWSLPSKKP